MTVAEFGRFVKTMRKKRQFADANNEIKAWTQDYLGDLAGYTGKTISDIERGSPKKLDEFYEKVVRLADAFGLTEQEKEVFYAKAGFVYEGTKTQVDREGLRAFLEDIPYPATIRTPVWDYIAFNRMHMLAWNYTDEVLRKLGEGDLGANNLRLVFDNAFEAQTSQKHSRWYVDTIRTFRTTAFPYLGTKRYNLIVTTMQRLYPAFRIHWEFNPEGGQENTKQDFYPRHSVSTVKNLSVGILNFISLRVSSIYLPDNLLVTVYMPASLETEERLQSLRRGVLRNDVHFFREFPLE